MSAAAPRRVPVFGTWETGRTPLILVARGAGGRVWPGLNQDGRDVAWHRAIRRFAASRLPHVQRLTTFHVFLCVDLDFIFCGLGRASARTGRVAHAKFSLLNSIPVTSQAYLWSVFSTSCRGCWSCDSLIPTIASCDADEAR
jgi:hypothetical protein